MARGAFQDRIRNAFRKTFKTAHGTTTLMYLYEHCFGNQSTFPQSSDPYRHAFNEGMRMALLLILEQLKEDDVQLREQYKLYNEERQREAVGNE
jgi:hypothetical protein